MTEEKAKPPTSKVVDDDKPNLKRKLLKPVEAHGETIIEIEFREPTAGDIVDCGDPVTIDYESGTLSINPPQMAAMMATLAGVPPSTIRAMGARDFKSCAVMLANFFIPAPRT